MGALTHFYTYRTHTKLRWKKQPLIDVLVREFRTRTHEYYLEAIGKGVITVNQRIVPPTYRLGDLDVIFHTVHFHEPHPPKISVIKEEEDFVVIDKPAGIPVHPTGGYFYYSVTKFLFPNDTVGCVNRLDMPVSGVLIVVLKNHTRSYDLLKTAEKIYVAKVRGVFPDTAEVDQPIGTSNGRVHSIMEGGKPSRTLFKRIDSRNGFSLVQCQPITGRTHQIRIHLKYLGFPIVNDILYGEGEVFGEADGAEHGACAEDISQYEDREKYECIVRHCRGENNRSFQVMNSFICLHAWKYVYNGETYRSEWPSWAVLN